MRRDTLGHVRELRSDPEKGYLLGSLISLRGAGGRTDELEVERVERVERVGARHGERLGLEQVVWVGSAEPM